MEKLFKTIKETILLSLAVIVIALIVNTLSPAGISLTSCFEFSNDIDDCPFPVINVTEARQLVDDKAALFVDARSIAQYKAGHIPAALSLPIYNMEEYLFAFLGTVQPDVPLITYCSCITCEDSHLLAEKLVELGYENIKVFSGGMAAWEEKGYTVDIE